MSFNIANRLNTIHATDDLSQKQTVIVDIVNTLPTKQALLIPASTETGAPVIDTK